MEVLSPNKDVVLEQPASYKHVALPIVAESSVNLHAWIIELDSCLNTNIKILPYDVNKVSSYISKVLSLSFVSLLLN